MKYVLIGGTGTLGTEIAKILTKNIPAENIFGKDEVVIFSRDEAKQQDLKKIIPTAQYVIGDIRDREAIANVTRGANVVFILAAIKHVDVAEENPLEAVKTNLLGVVNVAEECIKNGVDCVVFSNTDKAVLPITTYGYTKAIAEKYLLSLNKTFKRTKFSVFNWGNIIASRGSVIPSFVKTLMIENSIYITDKRMTRFWLPISDAANFMLDNYLKANPNKAMVPPLKGASVMRVAETVAKILSIKDYKINITGLRCVEKIHEQLESTHVKCLRSDNCEQYTDQELKDLLSDVVLTEAKKYRETNEGLHLRPRRQHGKTLPNNPRVHGARVVGV